MYFNEFVSLMVRKVKEELDMEVDVREYEAVKNNGVRRKGIVIESGYAKLSPTIYLEDYYEQYIDGSEIQDLVASIVSLYEKMKQKSRHPFDVIFDYEKIKNRIIGRLVNLKENEDLLKSAPYLEFYDLAMIPYVFLESEEMGAAAMQIRREHLEMWNVSLEEVLDAAIENSPHIFPAELGQLTEYMYILSNTSKNWGAVTIMYPGVMEKLYRIIGENFYLLPSSIHEFVLVPESFGLDEEYMKMIVSEINQVEVDEEEILSYSVYYYNSITEEIEIK